MLVIRELMETSVQSYQAYQMSRLLPHRDLNRFYTFMLVINCWSSALLHRFIRHKPRQRLLCILSDILLDFISTVWVPVYLAISYLKQYDFEIRGFPKALWYNDVWLFNLMNDSPIILFGFTIDALSRLLFSICLLTSLEDVKDLIRRRTATSRVDTANGPSHHNTKVVAVASVVFTSNLGSHANALIRAGAARRRTIITWIQRFMVAYGFAVLLIQIQAEAKSNTTGCLMELRPWLTTHRACGLIEMDCLRNPSLTGNLSDFDSTLGELNAASLAHVVYHHCPHVELGSTFQSFRNLVGMKIYNSTVTKWDALTNTHHPRVSLN